MDQIEIFKQLVEAIYVSVNQHLPQLSSYLANIESLRKIVNGDIPATDPHQFSFFVSQIYETFQSDRSPVCQFYLAKTQIDSLNRQAQMIEKMELDTIKEQIEKHRDPSMYGGKQKSAGGGVFIGHGRSDLYLKVKEMLVDDFSINAETFERNKVSGHQVIPTLEKMLASSGFAIIVATAEDKGEDGVRARQNVVHETGLFQGRLGFQNVAILRQANTTQYSNLSGLLDIPFDAEEIHSTFYDLAKALRAAGFRHRS